MRPDLPSRLESRLDAFDAAWQRPDPPRAEDFLPPASDPDRLAVVVGLVRIDLERRLTRGEAARVESYLARFPELRDGEGVLLGLVRLEYGLRRRREPAVSCEDCLARFPELASQLRDELTALTRGEGLGPAATPRGGPLLDLRSHELFDRLGRGGMGEVFRGKDPVLGRDLAVKVLRPELRGDPDTEGRFEREARVTGALQHPNIVPVHNLGRLPDGRLYFTMKLVRGRTLAEMLADGPARDRLPELLAVFEKVCQAVAYAHSKGVIHRDLKPHNVMVGAFGEVQVMDWGLAKVLRRSEETAPGGAESGEGGDTVRRLGAAGSTADDRRTGTVGTPAYMPPEQARGESDEVDERADVFGLGAILCELLTGRPPYTGENVEDTLDKARRNDTADAFGRLDRCGSDAELVGLCRECLGAKEGARPRDGRAVAERVQAYQAGVQERLRNAELQRTAAEARADEARAKVVAERRARRLAVGLAVAGAVFVVVLGAAAVALAIGAARQKELADLADGARADAQEEARQKGEERDRTKAALEKSRWQAYAGLVELAYREWQDGDLWRARATLDRTELEPRGWEFDYLTRACEGSPTVVKTSTQDVAFTADGKGVATVALECCVWDASTGERRSARRIDDAEGRTKLLGPGGAQVLGYGKGAGAKVWDGRSGKELFALPGDHEVVAAAFSPDGGRIATSDADNVILWDAGTGKKVAALTRPLFGVRPGTLAFSGDGRRIVAGSLAAGTIQVWDVATGELTWAPVSNLAGKRQTVAVCLNSDGSRAASAHLNTEAGSHGDAGVVRVWDLNQRKEAFSISSERVGVISLAFSPDGKHLVAGRGDGPILVWDARGGREVRRLRGHLGPPSRLAFGPDGRLVSAEADTAFADPLVAADRRQGLARGTGAIKVWDLNSDPALTRITEIEGGLSSLAFSPDGRRLATGGDRVGIWDVESGRSVKFLPVVGALISQIAFSADGRRVAAARSSGQCQVWDIETGEERLTWKVPPKAEGRSAGVAYSSDGKYLAIGHSEGVSVLDAETFREFAALTGGGGGGGVCFSPDGRRLAGGGLDAALKVWELDSGNVVFRQDGLGSVVRGSRFSPDGRLLACVTANPSVKVWDTTTGQLKFTLEGHLGNAFSVAFSPDGKRIATTSRDRTVKVWSAESGLELLTLPALNGLPWCVAFSPDGRRLACGGMDSAVAAAVLLWDSGRPADPAAAR
jgi:WD40 repeat protein